MKNIFLFATLLLSTVAFADGVNLKANLRVTGQYKSQALKELVSNTNVVSGSVSVSGRVDGQSINETKEVPATNVETNSVITVNDNGTIRMQDLKQGTDQTYRGKVKLNKDGSINQIKIKGSAIEKFITSQLGATLDQLRSEAGGSASVNLDIDDFVCKADGDLVGVYTCGTQIQMDISVHVH